MKKRNWKGFVAGVITTLLVCAMGVPALAATVQKVLYVDYGGISIVLDGEKLDSKDSNGNTVEPFIYNGTTYLPVRAVGEAFNKDVNWDGATKTVTLTTPNAIANGTIVYDDQYVTIAFDGIYDPEYSWSSYVEVKFMVTNKTDYELTFQSDAISFDGISYQLSGSEDVAPNSTGTISFDCYEDIPKNVTTSTGTISVIDFSYELFRNSYDAKWTSK